MASDKPNPAHKYVSLEADPSPVEPSLVTQALANILTAAS